jgi:ADP-ribose pyrophosphatase
LVEQYRPAVDTTLWEIPAGLLEAGETPLSCAKRELLEETGYEADHWEERLTFYTSPGFTNEKITLFVAKDLRKVANPRLDEISRCHAFDCATLNHLMNSGQIKDAKTILAFCAKDGC